MVKAEVMLSNKDLAKYYLANLNNRWSNASTLHRRNFDGHIVSMKQSGTHWLKNTLAGILAQKYNLPPLEHIQDDSIVGHTKSLPKYKNIPQIVHSHAFPHALSLKVPFLHYPKYLVLLRDMRSSLVAHYERFKDDYISEDFGTYLLGDPWQKKYQNDIFINIRFMNEWGDLCKRFPNQVTFIRYEDMQSDLYSVMRKVCDFFDIPEISDEVLKTAIEDNTKDKMAKKKPNPKVSTTIVRTTGKSSEDYFTPENMKTFDEICGQLLRHKLGYDYKIKS
ncbi:MAG: sulfotransferase domain-containing protein [Sneathiella sp.]|nr:sulfotransferase domain-containing protein [Sneathiella sp.]